MKKYDVAIIGAGSSGLSARRQVAKKTDNYIVIDNGILGTTCARVGCMPSKVLIQAGNDFYRKNVLSQMGISGGENLSVDTTEVMKHVRKLRDRFVKATMTAYDGWIDTHFVAKKAKFIDKNTLDLEGEKIWAEKIIIASGSRPIFPNSWNEFKDYLIDTNSFFELQNLPKKMAVIGLGVIGIELGQALHRLGIEVVAIGRRKVIGGVSDPEMIEYVSSSFSKELCIDYSGVQSLSKSENAKNIIIKTGEKEYEVEKILVATGRRPNLDKIEFEKTGISLNQRGIPKFNDETMQIENSSIYIAGDVNGEKSLLHEASDEGAIAGYNAVAEEKTSFERRTFLGITFSDPNIAIVGKSYDALLKEEVEFIEGRVSFEGQGRSIVKLKEKGLLKLYACPKTGLILGSEMFGPSIEHIAHLLAWSIQNKMNVHDILSMPFYHPVIEEGLRTAMRSLATQIPASSSPLEIKIKN